MRDYRDSKAMAHMLREALAEKNCKITVSDSLELVAHLFGVADWNTLSALIKNSDRKPNPRETREPEGPSHGPTFSRDLEATLHRSLQVTVEKWQKEAGLEHLLLSLTQDPDAMAIMKAAGIDPEAAREWLARSADSASPRDPGNLQDPSPSQAFQRAVQRAILDAQASGEREVTGAHLLLSILSEHDSTVVRIMWMEGLDLAAARKIARSRH